MKKLLLALSFTFLTSFTNSFSNSSASPNEVSNKNVEMFEAKLATKELEHRAFENFGIITENLPISLPVDTAGFTRISGYYGLRKCHPILKVQRFHKGIDFSGVKGTAIYPAASGKVIEVRRSLSYGKLIEIDHGNNITTLYAHLDNFNVQVGDTVTVTDKIAELGNTGMSSGPHLHFEVKVNNEKVNPLTLLFKETTVSESEIVATMLDQKNYKIWTQL